MTLIDPCYSDGAVTLYRGDCIALLPGVVARHGRPAHVLSDPPYSKRVQDGARSSKGGKGWRHGRRDHTEGEMGAALVPFAADEGLVREALLLASAERWTIAFSDFQHAAALDRDPPADMRSVRTGVWVKPDGAPQFTGDRPGQGWEAIAILHAADARLRWNGRGKRAVWVHPVERDIPWHPTPKPVPLLREIIRDFTDPGDLIIDPFGGSVATAVACRFEGRRCVTIELDETYARHGAQRLAEGRARPVSGGMPEDDGAQRSLFVRAAE